MLPCSGKYIIKQLNAFVQSSENKIFYHLRQIISIWNKHACYWKKDWTKTRPQFPTSLEEFWPSFALPSKHLSNKPNRGYSCILSLSQTNTNRLCCRPKQLPCYSSGISRMQCQQQHTLPFSSSHLLSTSPVPAVAGQLLIQESCTHGWTAPAPAYTLPPDLPAHKQHMGVLWHSPCTRC